MTTSPTNHRPGTLVAVAVTGLLGALVPLSLVSAQAIPGRDDPPTGFGRTDSHLVERACFIKPLTWDVGLDGPLPRCYTYVP